jgi:hypothetical protein
MFVNSPEASANIVIMSIVTFKSCWVGLMKTAASSAYKDTLKESQPLLRLDRRPMSCAFLKSLCNGSMASRKSIGERGLLALHPYNGRFFSQVVHLGGKRMRQCTTRKRSSLSNFWPNPRCSMMCHKYDQLTVSKTFEMSSLMKREGIFSCASP